MSALLVVVVVAGLLLSSSSSSSPAAATEEYGVGIHRRSLHQPFFPIDSTPPPGFDDSIVPPPPPPAAGAASASASKGGGRSSTGLTNTIAIALATGLVVLAVAFYSCFLLWRRRSDGGGGGGNGLRAVKSAPPGSVAVRVPSDVGSSARHQRSPPPSSTASDAIYLDPLTTMVEVSRHRPPSPDLRPLALVKQPSPDLRPLPPLKRPAQQPPPPPASTPPATTTGDSSDEDDQATYYTAPKTAKSWFSRSTSQRSTLEQTVAVAQPPAPAPVPTPTPTQANPPRPARPPPPPPPPRQRLLRPMPEESPPPAVLASLALTNSADPSVQDRGGENPDGDGGRARPPKPPSLKPLHWDKLRAISGRTTVWDQVNNSDSFRCDPLPFVFPQYPIVLH